MKKRLVLTGGGTAGHVNPNIALIQPLLDAGYELHYIGMKDSIEENLISSIDGICFHAIRSGKLRRYFSLKNFKDPFKVLLGIHDAKKILRKLSPALLFSKGGFVTVPAVIAASRLKIPIILHESDYTPGLANRIASRYATRILVSFADTLDATKGKGIYTGTPIREALFHGSRQKGLDFLGFSGNKNILLVMGGSQGAKAINDALRENLESLLAQFDIVHLCGKGYIASDLEGLASYKQFEYLHQELPDVIAAADVALSRSGANTIFEFLAVGLPALLIPLPSQSSRGDQILNANYFKRMGYADVLMQESLNSNTLNSALATLLNNQSRYRNNMLQANKQIGTQAVLKNIMEVAGPADAQ